MKARSYKISWKTASAAGLISTLAVIGLVNLSREQNTVSADQIIEEALSSDIYDVEGEGALIISSGDGITEQEASKLSERLEGVAELNEVIEGSGLYSIEFDGHDLGSVANLIAETGLVTTVEPDEITEIFQDVTPTDSLFLESQAEGMRMVNAPQAWSVSTGPDYSNPAIPDEDVIVAVLDTGVAQVPVLNNQVIELDVRLLEGYNAITGERDGRTDRNSHGTLVASTIAANGNSRSNLRSMTGYCWTCTILPVKVLGDSGTGRMSDVARGIIWATDAGADIINMSFGASKSNSSVIEAIAYAKEANVIMVASAGNNNSTRMSYPAAYPDVISVASTDISTKDKAGYSNYGDWIDFSAPASGWGQTPSGSIGNWQGTSYSAPVISGMVGVLRSINPNLNHANIISLLSERAAPNWYTNYGMPDFGLATRSAANNLPPRPTAPTGLEVSPSYYGASARWLSSIFPEQYECCEETIKGYEVELWKSEGDLQHNRQFVNNTRVSFLDLEWSTSYSVKVRSLSTTGTSDWSQISTFTMPSAPQVPSPPSVLAEDPSPSRFPSATVVVTTNEEPISYIDLQYSRDQTFETTTETISQTDNIFELRNLGEPPLIYYVRARAHNVSGTGQWSPSITIRTTLPAGEPIDETPAPKVPSSPIINTSTAASTANSITFGWSTSSDGGSPIAGFEIQYAQEATFSDPITLATTSSSITVSPLNASTDYLFRVRAINAIGNSTWSPAVSIGTISPPPNQTPSPPGQPPKGTEPSAPITTISSVSHSSASLSWTVEDGGGSELSGYEIQYTDTGEIPQRTDTRRSNISSITLDNLKPDTEYSYKVRAKNSGSGWGGFSLSKTFRTNPIGVGETPVIESTVPGAPTIDQIIKTATSIEAYWSATNGGANITRFEVELRDATGKIIRRSPDNYISEVISFDQLQPGTQFELRVRAFNANGEGAWSEYLTVSTETQQTDRPPADRRIEYLNPPRRLNISNVSMISGPLRFTDFGVTPPPGASAVIVNVLRRDGSSSILAGQNCGSARPVLTGGNGVRSSFTVIPLEDNFICLKSNISMVDLDIQGWIVGAGSVDTSRLPEWPLRSVEYPGTELFGTTTFDTPQLVLVEVLSPGIENSNTAWINITPCSKGANLDSSVMQVRRGESTTSTIIMTPGTNGKICALSSAPLRSISWLHIVRASTLGAVNVNNLNFSSPSPRRISAAKVSPKNHLVNLGSQNTSALVSLTVSSPSSTGWLYVYPSNNNGCSPPSHPPTSNLNFITSQDASNLSLVRTGPDGRFCVFSSVGDVSLFVDLIATLS